MRVRINNLSFAYGQKVVLSDINFSLNSGETLAIVGRNGTGKTTLVKCILKLLKVPPKTIFLDDIDINEIRKFHNIAYVPQRPEFNYEFPITVKEILSASYPSRKHDFYYKSTINSLQINKFYNENINNLSGGQLQRVFITRALLAKPKLIIFDEPTVGMDVESMNELNLILNKLKSQNITMIIVTHDHNFGLRYADYILKLDDNFTYTLDTNTPNNMLEIKEDKQ